MSVLILPTVWSILLIPAVLVCAAVLTVNVKKEVAVRKKAAAPAIRSSAARPEILLAPPEGELNTEQILAIAAYCWLHPEQPDSQGGPQ